MFRSRVAAAECLAIHRSTSQGLPDERLGLLARTYDGGGTDRESLAGLNEAAADACGEV